MSSLSPTDSTPKRSFRRRLLGLAAGLALSAVSLAVALLLAEGLIRLAAPQQLVEVRPDIWMPVDTLGWVHRPNLNSTINTGEGTVHVYTDSDGNRVGSKGRVVADRNILVLGDSYMAALQVEYEESIPGRIESSFAARGMPVSVRNTGVGSWEPIHYLYRAQQAFRCEPFDLMLVFVYLGNDVVPARRPPYKARELIPKRNVRFPSSLAKSEIIDALLYPINDRLEERSHLFIFIKQRGKVLLMKAGLTAREDPVELRVSEADGPQWGITADIFAEIAADAARRGTPTLFVFLPASYQVDRSEFEDYVSGFGLEQGMLDIDQPNRIMLREMRERGLDVVDPTEVLRAAHTDATPMHGRVDPHFSAAAHEVVSKFIEPMIVERLTNKASATPAP